MSIAQVIESIEREAFERSTKSKNEMSLVGYAEKVSPLPLSDWQKRFFEAYEQAEREDKEFVIMPGRNIGKTLALQIVNDWKKTRGIDGQY